MSLYISRDTTGGHFCGTPGSSEPDGECQQGYYCEYGVDTATPVTSHKGVGDPCTMGFYCPKGSTIPLSCPPGSYSFAIGNWLGHFLLLLFHTNI